MMEWVKKFLFCAALIVFGAFVFNKIPIKIVMTQGDRQRVLPVSIEEPVPITGSIGIDGTVDAAVSTTLGQSVEVKTDLSEPLGVKIEGQ